VLCAQNDVCVPLSAREWRSVTCRSEDLSERLVEEAAAIASSWYTSNKWPRVHYSYTKLFLPMLHIAFALSFTVEHILGRLSLARLQAIAPTVVQMLGAPFQGWMSRATLTAVASIATTQLPEMLKEYIFYFVAVPVFAIVLVRRAVATCVRVVSRPTIAGLSALFVGDDR
jgi:hypothetical protein